jgi:hypothetical protein
MQVPLAIVGNHVRTEGSHVPWRLDDRIPRLDFVELALRLGAKLGGCDLSDAT